jgi:DNA-binding LacI/PurR family transcriptional regulator
MGKLRRDAAAEAARTAPELAESLLAGGGCDLVGMTRALIADPQLPSKARTGRTAEIRPRGHDRVGQSGHRRRARSIKALTGYRKRLAALGVRLQPDTAVLAFDGERVLLRRLYDDAQWRISAAALVLATPGLPNDELATRLEEAGLPAVTISDARAPRLLDAAIREGFEVARQL